MSDVSIKKGFVTVGDGQIHYRTAGSGPPIIFLHDSPRSSVLHIPQLKEFSDRFTCIAIDSPGYGNSTPLDLGRQLEIPDFGTALANTIAAFGVERSPVYGFHTSSKITLSFAARHPERVAVAILDGLSLPPGGAAPDFIANYMRPFTIDDDGAFLAREWTRVLDFSRWFPWFAKTKETRSKSAARDMSSVHEYALDLFMAGPHFSDAYAAAMRFVALPVVSQLKSRTVIVARQDDVLHMYLASLPDPLPAGVTKESLPPDRAFWRQRLREIFNEHADFAGAANFTPPDPLKTPGSGKRIINGYVDVAHGQVLVRRAGGGAGRPIVFLPDLPGSARQDLDLLAALADGRPVYGIDLPGCGESTALPKPSAEAYVNALAQTLDALGVGQIDLIAEGLSTPLAAMFAARHQARVGTLLLDALVTADRDQIAEMRINYCADLKPQRDGAHLHRAFHMLRDQEVQWPWYDGSTGAIRRVTPRVGGQRLYVRLLDTLKQWDRYPDAIHAALDVDVSAQLNTLGVKAVICTVADDVRYAGATAAATNARAQILPRPSDVAARAQAFLSVLN